MSASRSTASGKVRPSVSIRKANASPCLPDEKSWKKPFWSLTKNDGVFSALNGDNPRHSRPSLRNLTRVPATSDTGRRALISSRNSGGNFMGSQIGLRYGFGKARRALSPAFAGAIRRPPASAKAAYPFVGAAASRSLADLRSDHRLAGISTVASWTFDLTSSGFTAPSTTVTTAGWPSANWIAAWRKVTLCFVQIASIAFTLFDHRLRSRGVIVFGARSRSGRQNAGIEHARKHHAHVLFERERQEFRHARLVDQRVAPGHHRDVEVAGLGEFDAGVGFVDPKADGLDDLFVAQLVERAIGALHRFLEAPGRFGLAVCPDVGVVNENDVEPV